MSGYGYQDSSSVGPGKASGKFGLNQGVFVTKFEYNPNGGKDGAAQDVIDLSVQVQEKEYMIRFFPVSKVYAKEGGGELTDPSTQEYKDQYAKEVALLSATLSDIVKAFVSEEDLKLALATPINSFADYAKILERLVKSVPNWQKQAVDIFLEYQWKPTGSNTRTFLTLPKNVKQGTFICKAIPGVTFKEERTDTHLKYIAEDGSLHPFKRTKWYVENAYANVTILEDESAAASDMNGTDSASGNAGGDW